MNKGAWWATVHGVTESYMTQQLNNNNKTSGLCDLICALYTSFIGRIDAEAEAPILWLPDAKSWLIRKDPEAGKD